MMSVNFLRLAVSGVEKEAHDWAASLSREMYGQKQMPELHSSILLPLAASNTLWQEEKRRLRKGWQNGSISFKEWKMRDEAAGLNYYHDKFVLKLFFQSVLQSNCELGYLPWQEFYGSWKVRKQFLNLQDHLEWVPRSVMREFYGKPDTELQQRGAQVEVHLVDRDETKFGDAILVKVFDSEGQEVSEEHRFSVGRYSLKGVGQESMIREGEGAAANSVEKARVPSDGVKRLFEEWRGDFRIIWHDDGTAELRKPAGRFDQGDSHQLWRWDPGNNTFVRLERSHEPGGRMEEPSAGVTSGPRELGSGRVPHWRSLRPPVVDLPDRTPQSSYDAAKDGLLEEFDGWRFQWLSEDVVEINKSKRTNTGTEYKW